MIKKVLGWVLLVVSLVFLLAVIACTSTLPAGIFFIYSTLGLGIFFISLGLLIGKRGYWWAVFSCGILYALLQLVCLVVLDVSNLPILAFVIAVVWPLILCVTGWKMAKRSSKNHKLE